MSDKESEINILEGAAATSDAVKTTKAVALEYDRATDDAPRVTASGKGAVAEQILDVAFANNIKVREDAELVEILSLVDVDSPIPLEAFAAVAEILTYVYQANASYKQRSVT
ncbi:MAG: EscU/YscU/HrcU family type III secretion system export apparatus switch protein [Rickettsiales bacterium]